MRAANNERALTPSSERRSSRAKSRDASRVPTQVDATEDGDAAPREPVRTCVLTRAPGSRDALIRLALGPDDVVAPDIRARAPGRGAWIGVSRPELERAVAKGKLKGALARAFKTSGVTVPPDLPARIATQLERAFLDRLGLEARAGTLVTGSDRIEQAARAGKVRLLLHASDAGEDGNRRLDQALRVGGAERDDGDGDGDGGNRGLVLPFARTILSVALGRENVVHIALTDPSAAARVLHALTRWRGFIGTDGGDAPGESIAGTSDAAGMMREQG